MITYHCFTKRPEEDIWHYNAVTAKPEVAFSETTLAYMSLRGLIYMVKTDEKTWMFEPDEGLAEKYKNYFNIKDGDSYDIRNT